MTSTTAALNRFTCVTNDYREMRTQLKASSEELDRLKQQRAATLQSSRDAGQRWRQLFKDAGGKPGKKVRELQAEEHTLAGETEKLDELIGELAPRVEELRHWTGQMRGQHVTSLHLTRREMAAARLATAMDAVFDKPEGQELLEALAQRGESLQQEVLEDSKFLASLGFDGHESKIPGFMGRITGDDRRKIAAEVVKRKRGLVADVVMKRLEELGDEHPRFDDALAAPLPPLACEQ
ncbi:hypothetical protein [Halomonas caseinilytica]|uniref:hypothetical protein n=1 Tax=Halomonas caseinilytica TaxID=438744 RepID=UPI000849680F|nr:hypothetical protein [Halomonas caseinilytica]